MTQGNQNHNRNSSEHPSTPSRGTQHNRTAPEQNPYEDAEPIHVHRAKHPHYSSRPDSADPANGEGRYVRRTTHPSQPAAGRVAPRTARAPHAAGAAPHVAGTPTRAVTPRESLGNRPVERLADPKQRGRRKPQPQPQPRHEAPRPTPEQIEAAHREEIRRQYHEVPADRAYAPSARRSSEKAQRQYASQQRRQQKHPNRQVRPRPIPGDDYFHTPDTVFENAREPQPSVTKRVSHAPAVIAMVVAVLAVAIGAFAWTHRSVQVTVDDRQINVVVGSTLKQVLDASGDKVSPGDLVAVTGDVITQGDGHAFSATINGNQVDDSKLASTSIQGGETIEFGNGDDRSEDYDVLSSQQVQPKLKMEGTEGSIFYVKQWGKAGTVETRKGKTSGKTADVTATNVQDLIIQRQGIAPQNDQKLVALTFDDGPSEYTDKYLDILDQYGIKATFFELGQQVDEYPDSAKRVVSDGMQLGSHTWDHKQLTKLNEQQVQDELAPSFQKIQDVTGVQSTTLRQPYGSMNANVWLYSKGAMSVSVFWTHDSEDWKRPGADKIVKNATNDMFTGAIILMHDGGGNRDQDVEALPQIIEAWQNAGYQFVTISQLMASDPRIPSEVASGDEQMPSDAVWPTEIASDSASNAIP